MIRIDARKLYIFAQIVVAFNAEKAFHARYARLYGDSVTRLQVSHVFTTLQDLPCSFMTKDAVTFNYKRTNGTGLPEMDVRAVSC